MKKNKTPDPYRLADLTIEQIAEDMLVQFEEYENELYLAKFDELNVIGLTKSLYETLDHSASELLEALFIERYEEVEDWVGGDLDEDEIDDLAEMQMAQLLETPNAVTKYSYNSEVLRKRDRLSESVNAVKHTEEKKEEVEKAMRLWGQMVAQYADETADAATVLAFRNAGVKKVVWHSQEDQRVCRECDELDGKEFYINALPDKPHWRCRCWITPA